MSRSDTLRSEIARLQATEATLRKTLASAEKEAAAARAAASKKRAEVARTKSPLTRRSAERAAEGHEKKIVVAESKAADAKAKLAANAKAQASKQQSLTTAERSEQRNVDRETEKRRTAEKRHAREVARMSGGGGPGSGGSAGGPIVRYVAVRPPEPEPLRVLYLTSNPEATELEIIAPDGTVIREGTWLRTEAEVRAVQQMLRGSKYRELVELAHRPAATTADLLDAVNDVRPHVVHFSGHGWAQGLIMDNGSVERPDGEELNFELLAELLSATTTPPRLLVMNACDTLGGAAVLLPSVPVVIAMSDSISDVAASVFAGQFYAAIASAQSVGVALQQAKLKMKIAQLEDSDLPEALTRDDIDIDSLVLVQPPVR